MPRAASGDPVEATCNEAIESARIVRLTKPPLLTYPLIIEDLRPEEIPRGRFSFPPHRGSRS